MEQNVYNQVLTVTEVLRVSGCSLFYSLCVSLEISGTKQFLTILLILLAKILFMVQHPLPRLLKFFY